jgi:hypothetical protein
MDEHKNFVCLGVGAIIGYLLYLHDKRKYYLNKRHTHKLFLYSVGVLEILVVINNIYQIIN